MLVDRVAARVGQRALARRVARNRAKTCVSPKTDGLVTPGRGGHTVAHRHDSAPPARIVLFAGSSSGRTRATSGPRKPDPASYSDNTTFLCAGTLRDGSDGTRTRDLRHVTVARPCSRWSPELLTGRLDRPARVAALAVDFRCSPRLRSTFVPADRGEVGAVAATRGGEKRPGAQGIPASPHLSSQCSLFSLVAT